MLTYCYQKGCLVINENRVPLRSTYSYETNALAEHQPSDQIVIDESLSECEKTRLRELVDEYQDIFS